MLASTLLCLAALAAPPASADAPGAAAPTPATADTRTRTMSWIGFQSLADTVRVFVRTDGPITYQVNRPAADHIELQLDRTAVAVANNLRPLDTQFFQGPVERVAVRVLETPAQTVVVDITLRAETIYTPVQKDNLLALDFPLKPAG